jgi:hypothetical protein
MAQIYAPIMFTIGALGESQQQTRFQKNKVLVKLPTARGAACIRLMPVLAR